MNLEQVTLVSMTSVDIDATIKALQKSCNEINFGAVLLITDREPDNLPYPIEYKHITPMTSLTEYSYNMIYKLEEYIHTDYALIIQADGYVVNPTHWKDEFLDYDYIGAPFALPSDNFSYRDIKGNIFRVGNGGFSLRSKKLIGLPNKLGLEWKSFHGYYNEDGFICAMNRHIYEEEGCEFAPLDIAKYFSHEVDIPETQGITPFGFHGKHNKYN